MVPRVRPRFSGRLFKIAGSVLTLMHAHAHRSAVRLAASRQAHAAGAGAAAAASTSTRAVTPKCGPVAVTGASGFLGSHLVSHLISHGYIVRACVRDKDSLPKTAHLRWASPNSTAVGEKLSFC